MGGFLQGPVVQFQFDISSIDEQLKKIFDATAQQSKKMAADLRSAAAGPLEQQAARLRALYSTGAIGLQQLQVEQKKFVALLDTEIQGLLKRGNLTKQELSTLKQITLERERQSNAIKRGVGVGVTSGTQSALGLVTGNVTQNI